MVRLKIEAEKGPLYRVSEINKPGAFSLLRFVEVIKKEQN